MLRNAIRNHVNTFRNQVRNFSINYQKIENNMTKFTFTFAYASSLTFGFKGIDAINIKSIDPRDYFVYPLYPLSGFVYGLLWPISIPLTGYHFYKNDLKKH